MQLKYSMCKKGANESHSGVNSLPKHFKASLILVLLLFFERATCKIPKVKIIAQKNIYLHTYHLKRMLLFKSKRCMQHQIPDNVKLPTVYLTNAASEWLLSRRNAMKRQ